MQYRDPANILTTIEVTANWRELGFLTMDNVQQTVTMMLCTTPKKDREWMLNTNLRTVTSVTQQEEMKQCIT